MTAASRATQMPIINQLHIGVAATAGSTFACVVGDISGGAALVVKVNTDSGPNAGLVILTPQK